jgi:hypothetical protein
MFERARAAGLPMLGGVDFYVTSACAVSCGRITGRRSSQRLIRMTSLGRRLYCLCAGKSSDAATIVILPGFTEFCEKYSQHVLRLHQSGHNVLIIDWPGQGLVRDIWGALGWLFIAMISLIIWMLWMR